MKENQRDPKVFELMNGDVRAWIEQAAIHLKAVDRGDPVELTKAMARKLAGALIEMATQIENEDAGQR